MYKPGTIVLVPFPFTDLSGEKVRPALIIAAQTKGEDVLVCFITSMGVKKDSHVVLLSENDSHFRNSGLKITSVIRATKLATLDRRVILGELGGLDQKKFAEVKKILKTYIGL